MKVLRRLLRIVIGLIALVVMVVAGGYAYVEASYDRDFSSSSYPNIEASKDPAVIAHGEYVANAIAHCSACHQPGRYDQPRKLGARHDLRGGMRMPIPMFGTFIPANITPHATGIGDLDDTQLARAIRHGVDSRGKIAPFMRIAVGPMSDEDLTAVISYLRTIPPRNNPVPPDEYGPIAKALLVSLEPSKAKAPRYVAPATGPAGISVERGRYLANGPAFCAGCHTPASPFNGFKPSGPVFSGNDEPEPDALDKTHEFVAPNLTPDPETGIMAAWPEDAFLARFRAGRVHAASTMPWENFQQMTDEDLRSLYRYLRTVPKVRHAVGPSRRPVGWKPPGT
jgi:mono/diheme cytochrome c family protein